MYMLASHPPPSPSQLFGEPDADEDVSPETETMDEEEDVEMTDGANDGLENMKGLL